MICGWKSIHYPTYKLELVEPTTAATPPQLTETLVMEEESEEEKQKDATWATIYGNCQGVRTSERAVAELLKPLEGLNREACRSRCETNDLCTFAVHDWSSNGPSSCRLYKTKPGDHDIDESKCMESLKAVTMLKPPLRTLNQN